MSHLPIFADYQDFETLIDLCGFILSEYAMKKIFTLVVLCVSAALSACVTDQTRSDSQPVAQPAQQQQPAASSGKTATQAPQTQPAVARSGVAPGMNGKGEVVDSGKIEFGSGVKTKGLNGWEGEIFGKPAPGSKFNKIRIGMSQHQVEKLLGEPSDWHEYTTGKAWIPVAALFMSDIQRMESIYPKTGRIIYGSGNNNTDTGSFYVIGIVNNAHEHHYFDGSD